MSVKIRLLGVPQAQGPTGIVHFRADKRYQFLAYLAYKNDWVSRDELAHLFWSDVSTEVARHSLRQLIKRLKILSLPSGFEIEHERLRWYVASDVAAFKQALLNQDSETARELYQGDFLTGLESGEDNEFHVWLFKEREALKMQWQFLGAMPLIPKPSLAVSTTPFTGRVKERAKITALLQQDDCRLVTLLALGGMGKTRLALELAKDLEGFFEAIYFVGLESVIAANDIPLVIAEALGLDPPSDAGIQPIVNLLNSQQTLLVLDNYEQLMEGVSLLAQLLQQCANLTLLVTSRERLNLAEEWLYHLEGLGEDSPHSLSSDAAKLFLERAQRVDSHFYFRDSDAPQFMDLCQRFGGSPLALELAAPWLRVMSFTDLAQELTRSWEMLENNSSTKKPRQQSLRAVFEHSWQLLTVKEQELLQRLAVFYGSFSKDAASSVAGSTITLLAVLLDKSLLRSLANGRYDRHPLIHEYALEKLAARPDQERLLRDKHSDYFLEYVCSKGQELLGSQSNFALQDLGADYENIRRAWLWACANLQHPENGQHFISQLKRTLTPLSRYLELQARFQDAISLFEDTAAQLAETEPRLEVREFVACLWIEHGYHLFCLDQRSQAVRFVKQGLALLHPTSKSESFVKAQIVLGGAYVREGEYDQALEIFSKLLTHAAVMSESQSYCISYLASCYWVLGQTEAAETQFRLALELDKKNGNVGHRVLVMNDFGAFLLDQDRLGEAKEIFETGLHEANMVNVRMTPCLLSNLAEIDYKCGDFGAAEKRFAEALELNITYGQVHSQWYITLWQSRLDIKADRFEAALKRLKQTAEATLESKDTPLLLEAAAVYVEWCGRKNIAGNHAQILKFIEAHPSSRAMLKKQVATMRQQLPLTQQQSQQGSQHPLTLDVLVSMIDQQTVMVG
jgi:predicted ATPase/Tfp pilus assembly protein PilF